MIAITGGIGAGKSTVSEMLVARGATLIDADQISREVVAPGTPTLAAIVERFGTDVLAADGSLDRPALAKKAFATAAAKADLEAITHPAIAEEFMKRVASAPDDAIVLHDIPLLAESKSRSKGDYAAVIVVEAPVDVRLDRLESRGVERDDARRRMAAQATDEKRRELATWVIDNGGDLGHLEGQVDAIWNELVDMAGEPVS